MGMMEDSGPLDLVTDYPAVLKRQLQARSKSHGRVCIMTLPRTIRYFNCGFYYYKYILVELSFEEKDIILIYYLITIEATILCFLICKAGRLHS